MMRNEAMVVEMSADQRENHAEKRGSADNRQNLRRGNFSADNTIQMSKTSSTNQNTKLSIAVARQFLSQICALFGP